MLDNQPIVEKMDLVNIETDLCNGGHHARAQSYPNGCSRPWQRISRATF